MRTLIKAFNEKDHLRNTIVALSLKVERIVFLVRQPFDKSHFDDISIVFEKHLQAKIIFETIRYECEKEDILRIFEKISCL